MKVERESYRGLQVLKETGPDWVMYHVHWARFYGAFTVNGDALIGQVTYHNPKTKRLHMIDPLTIQTSADSAVKHVQWIAENSETYLERAQNFVME